MQNYIALAIPFFLLFIGVEILVARAQGRKVYRLQDALADLGCGIGQQVVLVLVGAALLATYVAIYRHARLVTFRPGSFVPWIIAFVGVDLIYYIWHRLSHEVNFLWAAHVVHHQSEDYNLAVALRQSILTNFTTLPFHLPLAVLGVPPTVYVTMEALSTLYQFWIHTQLVGKLGFLERLLNTPSHHRVHHAVNPRYLDRNYGAIFIVWDRLFGTFAEEREPPVFGTVKPFQSFNPGLAQVAAWVEMVAKARPLARWRDRLRVFIAPPASGAEPLSPLDLERRAKWSLDLSPSLKAYALVQFAALVAATFLLLLGQDAFSLAELAIPSLLVLWALVSVGALLDGRRWGSALEFARLGGVALGTAWAARNVAWLVATIGVCAGMAVWLAIVSSRFGLGGSHSEVEPRMGT